MKRPKLNMMPIDGEIVFDEKLDYLKYMPDLFVRMPDKDSPYLRITQFLGNACHPISFYIDPATFKQTAKTIISRYVDDMLDDYLINAA